MNEDSKLNNSKSELTYLVSSAIEATWPVNQPVVFLGQWCLRYSRREKWSSLDYSVAHYHWDDRAQIPKDLEYISAVYETLLPELVRVLNDIHGVDYSVRYWRIVVGWWLFFFAQIFFDRWQVMHAADKAYPNSRMLRMPTTSGIPASHDMPEFLEDMASDPWNERLSAEIATRWTRIQVDGVVDQLITMEERRNSVAIEQPRTSIRGRIRTLVTPIMHGLRRRRMFYGQGVSLHSDYLRLGTKLKLAVMLRQIPSMDLPVQIPTSAVSIEQRKWTLFTSGADAFASALAELVPLYLPSCYLEGYTKVSKLAESTGPLLEPRVIMTANAFFSDDLWKVWAAFHVERGAKLVIAQHGGHYGTGAWSATQMHEIAISDRYLSWGWTDESQPKVQAAPATKLVGMPRRKPNRAGKCLQVTSVMPMQSYWMYSVPVGPQFISYLDDQITFAESLSEEVRDKLIVRLHSQEFDWDIAKRWRQNHPTVELDLGHRPISEIMRDVRLYVSTYNATTFLEAFTWGVPTVMFWNSHLWELNQNAEPYFEELRSASVMFNDPESCARHVNAIWEDVPGWWESENVQLAVSKFANRFAYSGKKPLRELKAALTLW